MKSILITCLVLFLSTSNSIAQNRKVNFGLNANIITVLAGNYEGVLAINLTNRITLKTALNVTYSGKHQMKSRCAIADRVENRVEKGWSGKLNIDYIFWNFEGIDCYVGAGLLYSDFKTSGTRGIRAPNGTDLLIEELRDGGDIFAGGISLGTKFKLFNRLSFDVGLQVYHHKGDKYQVGSTCKGTIPGVGAPYSGNNLAAFYIYVMIFK